MGRGIWIQQQEHRRRLGGDEQKAHLSSWRCLYFPIPILLLSTASRVLRILLPFMTSQRILTARTQNRHSSKGCDVRCFACRGDPSRVSLRNGAMIGSWDDALCLILPFTQTCICGHLRGTITKLRFLPNPMIITSNIFCRCLCISY